MNFDAFVMIDWSAANRRGRRGGEPNGIWVALAEGGAPAQVVPHATRGEATTAVTATLRRLRDAGARVLVGWDLVLGYPEGTAAAIGADAAGSLPWRATWEVLCAQIVDDEENRSNRFAVAAALNRRMGLPPGPFWGLPQQAGPRPGLLPTKSPFPHALPSGRVLTEYRAVERMLRAAGHKPKSAWQLYGAGSVGSQGLTGIPRVAALRADPMLAEVSAVWPFETGFNADPLAGGLQIVHAEIYPSLLPPDPALHPVKDAAQVLALLRTCRAMQVDGTLLSAFDPPDVPSDACAAAAREEGWVLPIVAPSAEVPLLRAVR